MSVFRNLLMQSTGWLGKPSDWSDIRKDCPADSIALYAGHTADYSQYDNLGFTATCVGGYNVYIDGEQYGTTYASGATCSITWSTSGITTGDDITTPSALKAHKIWISPATNGNNITAFRCDRVAASGTEQQGVLWGHFNLTNAINLLNAFGDGNQSRQYNKIMKALTAKNNLVLILKTNTSNFNSTFTECNALEYLPIIDGNNGDYTLYRTFRSCINLPKVIFKNINAQASASMVQVFDNCQSLAALPNINLVKTTRMDNFLTKDIALKDTVLDVSSSKDLKAIGTYGTSQYFMSGFKGLRVSNEAPFDNATAPQINVSYTGMDRTALVQLFNDLPYNVGYEVVGSPTINNGVVSGFTTSDYTKTSLSLSSDNEKIRIKIRFKTPETFVSGNTNILTFGNSLTTNNCIRVYTGSSSSRISSFGHDINVGSPNLQTDTFYVVDVLIDGNKQYSYLYDDNNNKLAESAGTTKIANFNNIGFFGGRFYSPIQEIDFNNTSIEVNDIPFFRGQAAMTKTLSCVGATGTADLTADDKDIALNKNWSLTLS